METCLLCFLWWSWLLLIPPCRNSQPSRPALTHHRGRLWAHWSQVFHSNVTTTSPLFFLSTNNWKKKERKEKKYKNSVPVKSHVLHLCKPVLQERQQFSSSQEAERNVDTWTFVVWLQVIWCESYKFKNLERREQRDALYEGLVRSSLLGVVFHDQSVKRGSILSRKPTSDVDLVFVYGSIWTGTNTCWTHQAPQSAVHRCHDGCSSGSVVHQSQFAKTPFVVVFTDTHICSVRLHKDLIHTSGRKRFDLSLSVLR